MSETPKYRIGMDSSDEGGGEWSTIDGDGCPMIEVHGNGHAAFAERIARLLTEDDERIERRENELRRNPWMRAVYLAAKEQDR